MATTGVIVGRFQVPSLHDGHKYLIEEVMGKHKWTVILLGESPRDGRNPLPYDVRASMIKDQYPDVVIGSVADHISDEVWSEELDNVLNTLVDPILYCSRDGFVKSYHGRYPIVELSPFGEYNGTALREKMEYINSEDFRKGIIFAFNYLKH